MEGKPAVKHQWSVRCRVGSPALTTATCTLITLLAGKAWTDDGALCAGSITSPRDLGTPTHLQQHLNLHCRGLRSLVCSNRLRLTLILAHAINFHSHKSLLHMQERESSRATCLLGKSFAKGKFRTSGLNNMNFYNLN